METNKEMSIDARIALIYANTEKLIKHFKLDRRSKNNPDDQAEVETAAGESDILLRDILGQVEEISNRKEFTAEQNIALRNIGNTIDKALRDFQQNEYRELKTSLEQIGKALDELNAEKQDNIIHHRHAIDIVSSRVFLSIVIMGLMILGLSYVTGNQRRTIDRLNDNGLKYRYIQMRGEATPADILSLREVFEFNRNPDSIKTIRRRVERYEQLIRWQAENEARAKLNASEAQRLLNQAKTVKEGK